MKDLNNLNPFKKVKKPIRFTSARKITEEPNVPPANAEQEEEDDNNQAPPVAKTKDKNKSTSYSNTTTGQVALVIGDAALTVALGTTVIAGLVAVEVVKGSAKVAKAVGKELHASMVNDKQHTHEERRHNERVIFDGLSTLEGWLPSPL